MRTILIGTAALAAVMLASPAWAQATPEAGYADYLRVCRAERMAAITASLRGNGFLARNAQPDADLIAFWGPATDNRFLNLLTYNRASVAASLRDGGRGWTSADVCGARLRLRQIDGGSPLWFGPAAKAVDALRHRLYIDSTAAGRRAQARRSGSVASPAPAPVVSAPARATAAAAPVRAPASTTDESRCVTTGVNGTSTVLRNTCPYKVIATMCVVGVPADKAYNYNDCEKPNQRGTYDIAANGYQAAIYRGAAQAYWFACRAPQLPADVQHVRGRGLVGRCR